MATASLPLLGEHCTQVGVFAEDLVTNQQLPVLQTDSISKGVVYELNVFRSAITLGILCMNG